MVKHHWSLQKTRFHGTRVQWQWALHHSNWRLALRMVILGLCAAARPWKHISGSSHQTVLVLTLLPESVWNSVVNVATDDRLFFHTTHYSTQRSHSVNLCGSETFPLHKTALTVDRGSSRRAEIWWTDFLERWHHMTVPHWKSLRSSISPILLPMFVYGDCMAVYLILYTCQQWVWLK